MDAARTRKSIAAVMRERMTKQKKVPNRKVFWKKLDKFAKAMAKRNPGLSLSEKLIEMRYEQ